MSSDIVQRVEKLSPKNGDVIVLIVGPQILLQPDAYQSMMEELNHHFRDQGVEDLQWVILPQDHEIRLSLLQAEKVPHPELLQGYSALSSGAKPLHPLLDPQWHLVESLDDWRNLIPVALRQMWAALGTETRMALVYMALALVEEKKAAEDDPESAG